MLSLELDRKLATCWACSFADAASWSYTFIGTEAGRRRLTGAMGDSGMGVGVAGGAAPAPVIVPGPVTGAGRAAGSSLVACPAAAASPAPATSPAPAAAALLAAEEGAGTRVAAMAEVPVEPGAWFSTEAPLSELAFWAITSR
jgi:hypothetical protein